MTVDVFIVSYEADIRWLAYSIATICKNLRGYRDIVLIVSEEEKEAFKHFAKYAKIYTIPAWEGKGYVWQQWAKMRAWEFSDANAFLFVDSDTWAMFPCSVQDFLGSSGKPVWYFEKYARVQTPWKVPTTRAMKHPVEYEFMRCLPCLIRRETLTMAWNFLVENHKVSCEFYLKNCIDGVTFSEFNYLGAVSFYHQDKTLYDWEELDGKVPKNVTPAFSKKFVQHWSHSFSEDAVRDLFSAHPGDLSFLADRDNFGLWLSIAGYAGFGAEIGVAYGENACKILNGWRPGGNMLLIDPWNVSACGEYVDGSASIDFDGAFNYALTELSKSHPGRFAILRETSDRAADRIPDKWLDFVYIDGNHHNPQLLRDLQTWIKKVKPGGIIAGHDFYDCDLPHYRCEVKTTVSEFFAQKQKVHLSDYLLLDQSWYVQL